MDTRTTKEVMELIQEIAKDNHQTIVMVTHDRGLANYADKIIRVLDGKIQSIEIVDKNSSKEDVSEEMKQEIIITDEANLSDSEIENKDKKEGTSC